MRKRMPVHQSIYRPLSELITDSKDADEVMIGEGLRNRKLTIDRSVFQKSNKGKKDAKYFKKIGKKLLADAGAPSGNLNPHPPQTLTSFKSLARFQQK